MFFFRFRGLVFAGSRVQSLAFLGFSMLGPVYFEEVQLSEWAA